MADLLIQFPNPEKMLELGLTGVTDLSKQLIALATGILALTVTFTSNPPPRAHGRFRGVLKLAWVLYLLSIFAGIWTLQALTGDLMYKKVPIPVSEGPFVVGNNVTRPAFAQLILFWVGTFLIMVYGWRALGVHEGKRRLVRSYVRLTHRWRSSPGRRIRRTYINRSPSLSSHSFLRWLTGWIR